jgi:hypothetical protein
MKSPTSYKQENIICSHNESFLNEIKYLLDDYISFNNLVASQTFQEGLDLIQLKKDLVELEADRDYTIKFLDKRNPRRLSAKQKYKNCLEKIATLETIVNNIVEEQHTKKYDELNVICKSILGKSYINYYQKTFVVEYVEEV